ncbi:MAG TPA: zinc ABC transporter substrate-binding protein, partial [Thermomicrobiales bacterium]|nr:zinc ABC transporter substrate-binding protein [Thermomicrobiales bacterium]
LLPLRPTLTAARQDDDPIRVTTTVGMVADAVRNVGGDRVDVAALMGPGIDPHLYTPGASDIEALSEADIIFYVGLELEGRMGETLEGVSRMDIPTIAVGESVPEDQLLASQQYENAPDPHIWFSVPLWKLAVDAVRDALIEHSPDDAETFETNAAAYQEQLDELDAYVREQAETVPEELRVLVTAHDAFGYFGEEYGFEVRGIQGISTSTEAGAGDIQDLADFIAERQIPAIYVESSVPPSTIEALQEACRSRDWDVQIGGQLFSDAMGEDGTPEGTYIGMVTHNIDTIVGGLTGEATGSGSGE